MLRHIDLLVPIDYATNRGRTDLAQASIAMLDACIEYIQNNEHPSEYVLAFGNTHRPDKGLIGERSRQWKNHILDGRISSSTRRFAVDITSSIDEARNIRDALREDGVEPLQIILFCDRWHAIRLEWIWGYFFPNALIETIKVPCIWGPDYATFFQQSAVRWAAINLLGAVGVGLVGVERLDWLKQPI